MQIKQWLARVTGAAWAGLPPVGRGPGPGSDESPSVRSLSRISRPRYSMQLTRPPGPHFVSRAAIGPNPLYTGASSQ